MWPWNNTPTAASATAPAPTDAPPARTWVGWASSVLGGWPGPRLLTKSPAFAADRDELEREKVHSGPSGVKLPWLAPYIDDPTQEPEKARAAYRLMFADAYCKGALLGKVLNVAALDLEVHPANGGRRREDRDAADFVRYVLTEGVEGGWPGVVWSVLSGGLIDGYSLCEKVLGPEQGGRWAGKWSLQALKPKDVGHDVVVRTDAFRNVVDIMGLRYNGGQSFAPGLFVRWANLPLYGSPVGVSDFRAAYKHWWMLDTVTKLRAINAEKNSTPFLVGTYTSPSQKPTLDEMLAAVKARNWASVPEGVRLDAHNIAGAGEGIFSAFVKDLKHDIFMAITGASLQSVEGTVEDGRGNSGLSGKIADRWSWWLAVSLAALVNDRRHGLVRELVDLNFVVSDHPRVSLSGVDAVELSRELDIDERLAGMGLDLDSEELYERYGRRAPAAGKPGILARQREQDAQAAQAAQVQTAQVQAAPPELAAAFAEGKRRAFRRKGRVG